MTIANMTVVGQIKSVKHRMAGDTPVCEVSVCKKKYQKDKTAEPEFDWFRICIWGKIPDFMAAKLVKGNIIGATGQFATRTWQSNEGPKTDMEIKCQSSDVMVDGPNVAEGAAPQPAPQTGPRRPAPAQPADEPPF